MQVAAPQCPTLRLYLKLSTAGLLLCTSSWLLYHYFLIQLYHCLPLAVERARLPSGWTRIMPVYDVAAAGGGSIPIKVEPGSVAIKKEKKAPQVAPPASGADDALAESLVAGSAGNKSRTLAELNGSQLPNMPALQGGKKPKVSSQHS